MDEIPEYKYIAYIDESGDEGLTNVKPLNPNGSSEWLVLSAVVVAARREDQVLPWVKDIISDLKYYQRQDLHFSKMGDANKAIACSKMSTLPIRCFTVASNKKNMEKYRNMNAEKVPSRNWFYCWLMRLLLERVTNFVKTKSLEEYGKVHKLKIEYSDKGGHSYSQMKAYYYWLKLRPLYLPYGKIEWDVMHPDLQESYVHHERAGVQLADIVAGAFFKACDIYDTGGCDPQYAKLLKPKMARIPDHKNGQIAGYGLKLMPGWIEADLRKEQQEIFRFFGFPKYWWAPDSSTS